jgi:hypothetical protein
MGAYKRPGRARTAIWCVKVRLLSSPSTNAVLSGSAISCTDCGPVLALSRA